MAENYLITGYWGEPHVTSENDRGINAAIFGAGRFVLPVGEQFRAEYIGNNTVRIYDGKLIDNGAVAGIPAGEYVDLLIPEAGQGMKRNDLIIFQYSQDASTLIERGVFMVLSGEETSGTATDPALSQQDILTNEATLDQMALWRVPVSGTVISAPEILYNTKFAGERIVTAHSENGENYTVELPGIAKLYTGLEITIIPDTTSTTTLPKLNINGLGDVHLKRRITGSTSITVQSEGENFLVASQPIRVFYNGKVFIADMARPHATDIYGSVPIECGGTGADNAEEARNNLGASATGHTHEAGDITSGKFSTSRLPTVPVDKGGTGATDAATARSNLGITPANIGAIPNSKIIAVAKSITFDNGIGTYENSAIASGAIAFAQFRAGQVNTLTDSILGVYPFEGYITIVSKLGQTGALPVLILVINP